MPAPKGPQFINLLDEAGNPRAYKKLYHGTRAELNEGDIISPEHSAKPGRNLSFATPSLSAARRFAGQVVLRPPTNTEKGFERDAETPGHIYEVIPVDTEDTESTWAREMKYFKPRTTEIVSNKGFKVVRRVSSVKPFGPLD